MYSERMEPSEPSEEFFQIVDQHDQPVLPEDSSRLYEAAFDDNLRTAVVSLENAKRLYLLAQANQDENLPTYRKNYTDAELVLSRVTVGLMRRYSINLQQAQDAVILCRQGFYN